MEMISITNDQNAYNLRVGGIFIHNGKVLLHTIEGNGFWVLPGGRCNFGENTAEALKREMQEEMKTDINVRSLCWVVENFFTHNGKKHQNTGFYYLADFEEGHPYYKQEDTISFLENGKELLFRWFKISELHELTIYPSFLPDKIDEEFAAISHIVHEDHVPETVYAEGLEASAEVNKKYYMHMPRKYEEILAERWHDNFVVVEGKTYYFKDLKTLSVVYGNRTAGLLTFTKEEGLYRIITLNSEIQHRGIGGLLLEELKLRAAVKKVGEIIVSTTNDNTRALEFYQKNGFRIDAVCKNTISKARRIKPKIPLNGLNGIEIKDEIRLKYITGEGR